MAVNVKSDIETYVIMRVKEMRESAGLSQSELALRLDVSNGFIGQAESSKSPTKYNLNHLNKLAVVFDCSLKDFMPEKPFSK
ncbi:helix-turn-helix transcriptional regulator [Mucilaginibacter daejeonensis]|uniref:helix-turn-helix domain-containing protein n=1 Tax=Mucilaginibacter daejeonensis TaxID=398049 RepID=UPI001D17BB04|nr:helix-turn-helix transcriptional regulator [Mucilaginibacter daejeonensis]UEG53436.1 helix-turn-helix transcriptional regulator [Mucilaginibacter daejeonensis]